MNDKNGTKFDISVNLLISCKDNGRELVIPGEYEGVSITKIAAGFFADQDTEKVTICEGIQKIGSRAFRDCAKLAEVRLPESLIYCHSAVFNQSFFNNRTSVMYLKRRYRYNEYEGLLQDTVMLSDGRRMLTGNYAQRPEFSEIFRGFEGVGPIVNSVTDIESLYIDCVSDHTFRNNLAKKLIMERREFPENSEAELLHDRLYISGKKSQIPSVIIAYYKDNDVEMTQGSVSVTFTLRFLTAFLAGIESVNFAGEEYFVYREMYLSSDKDNPAYIISYPEEIYDGNGDEVHDADGKIAKKYRLLSIIG